MLFSWLNWRPFTFRHNICLIQECWLWAAHMSLLGHLRISKFPFPNTRSSKFNHLEWSYVPFWVGLSSQAAVFYHQRGSISHCHVSFYSDSRNSELALCISFIHLITNIKHTKKIQAIENYVHENLKFLSQPYTPISTSSRPKDCDCLIM